jgi:hypothetical protein
MAHLDLTGENTLESLASRLQIVRTDILYVCNGLLYSARDLDDLVKQDFPLNGFDIGETFPNPNPTWILYRNAHNPLKGSEFYFFREDVAMALTSD